VTEVPRLTVRQKVVSGVGQLIFPVALFWSAGTLKWPTAWVFLGMFVIFGAVVSLVLRKRDPALLKERFSPPLQPGQPLYDKVFYFLFVPVFLLWLPVMGLDAVRLAWSDPPAWLQVVGGFLFSVALVLLYTVFTSNTFLSPVIRVQAERKQTVVDSGLYGVVRHPMYSSIGLMALGASLLMGSYMGVGIAILLTVMLAVRSVLEEGTLARELEGYEEYRGKVRYRMIPGLW
jgi:protein-S-isoprenylcysteine O-methyltransferase Ste14